MEQQERKELERRSSHRQPPRSDEAILQILKFKGFNEKWRHWISNLLATGSSSVLLTGIPGKQFRCKRGVRQGDPLSPLLFVLAADLLQSVVNAMLGSGALQLPFPSHDPDFPIIQYADDTLLIMQADEDQVIALKEALQDFSSSTGLDINYHKSSMYPINIHDDELIRLAAAFGCQTGTLPFTYLGLPVGTTRPKMVDFLPLVDCMERRLTASSCFLNQGGKLQLLNSVISSMPTYYLCSLHIPAGIIKQLERIQRQCLWRKYGKDSGKSLTAWDLVCRPKRKGV